MRIRLKGKRASGENTNPAHATILERGHASSEVLVAAAFLGVVLTFLYGAFSVGFGGIQSTRENLRASQILMQRAEALRLFTGGQVHDLNSQGKPLFVERDDPLGVGSDCGAGQYAGYVSGADPAVGALPAAHPTHMRPVTLTLCWTNYIGAKPIVHSRQVATRLARNGAPKYIWGAL
jgi:hypothetical protein